MKGPAHIVFHVAIIVVSAGIALSLPYTVSFISSKFLVFWSLIENEKVFLVSIEIICAMIFIGTLNYARSSLKDRKLAKAAKRAGLVLAPSRKGLFRQKLSKSLKTKQGMARDIMLMGSTGYRTFVQPKTDLHETLKNCREAQIILLDPSSEGARIRSKSIPHPDVTIDRFREQIQMSIDFLKGLNEVHRNLRLKLYSDVPFLKLTVLGDYMWVQHYHSGVDVESMPEYVFKHNGKTSGFYEFFYQYFLNRWNDPAIPEYDFETGELIYRDVAGRRLEGDKLG